MLIKLVDFLLKDGRKAVIRCATADDIPGMLDYLFISAGETDFILRYPEDCWQYTPEGEKQFIERMNASENECMLVCLVEGKVAGNCQIVWSKNIKTRHRANVAIALLREFWNQGLGTRMIQEMIRIAEENEHILQLELEFLEGNIRARALYEKMGFRITGVRPDAVRLKDGTLLNEYLMIKKIR